VPGGEWFHVDVASSLPLGEVRAMVRSRFEGVVSPSQLAEVVLAAHELVVNARQHGAPGVRLSVSVEDSAVLVEVVDGQADGQPRVVEAGEHGGRGLAIVDALSVEWGVEHFDDGKRVWARLPRRARPAAGTG
jgi:two-component sensor histidine kinase